MEAYCSMMVDLSESTFLRLSLVFNLVVSLAAFPLLIWASCKLWSKKNLHLFHANTKIIIQMHLLGFILHCVGRIILHTLDLYNYFFREPCDMIPNIYRCFIFRLMYNTGLWIVNCTAVPLIIERTIATYRSISYENKCYGVGIFLCFVQFGIAAVPLVFAYSNTHFDGVIMPYCLVYKPQFPSVAKANSYTAIGAQIIARIYFSFLLRINKRLRSKLINESLSTRYQIEQNMSSIECLQMFANLSSAFIFLHTSLYIILLQFKEILFFEYVALMEMIAFYPTYAISTVVVICLQIKKIRNKVHADLKENVNLDGSLYLENFKKQMNGPE